MATDGYKLGLAWLGQGLATFHSNLIGLRQNRFDSALQTPHLDYVEGDELNLGERTGGNASAVEMGELVYFDRPYNRFPLPASTPPTGLRGRDKKRYKEREPEVME